jgi:uncharacterized membrane protein YgcG/uncharacterized membrane protein
MKYLSYLLLVIMTFTSYSQDFPKYIDYINDYLNVITVTDKDNMQKSIYDYEKQTSIEISVAIVADLQGETLEEYTTDLFDKWGINKKNVNDRVLILLALENSSGVELRIKVGYGLEKFLTDYNAKKITDGVMPLLKAGDYTSALVKVLKDVKNVMGMKTKQMRDRYIAEQNKDREETIKNIGFTMITIIGVGIIIGLFVFLFKIYAKSKKRKEDEQKFKNMLLITVENLLIQINNWLNYAESLEADGFSGADETVRKLVIYKTRINNEFLNSIKKEKRHEKILAISKDVDDIINNSNKMVKELQKNKDIDITLRKNLENKISTLEQQILRAIPNAKDAIDRVNKDNPQIIWRGFNYSDVDRQVENFINKAKQLVRESLSLLSRQQFDSANDTAISALKSMNNASIFVQSIFDIEKQLNASKEQYNRYIANIPKLIKEAEQTVARQYVKYSTRDMVDTIKQKYTELKAEIAKNDKTIDWIVIGALVMSIINDCTDVMSISIKDIKNYEDEQEDEKRR